MLIVDDDLEILDLVGALLRSQGLRIFTAEDGKQMWDVLGKEAIDLLVLDILLPGKDGLTLCKEIRTKSDVPIIMLTALDAETARCRH